VNAATITVKCFGPLRKKMESDRKVTISENESIHAVVERLSIDLQPWYLYSVNGEHVEADASLHDGDVLMIIAPVSGG
jgi:molybdopterin converting factor small subunit